MGVFKDLPAESRRGRPSLEPDGEDARHVGIRLRKRYTGSQARNALVAKISQKKFIAIELLRKNQIRAQIRETEILRCHADDRARLSIDHQAAPNCGGAPAESPLPVAISQDHGCRRTRTVVG